MLKNYKVKTEHNQKRKRKICHKIKTIIKRKIDPKRNKTHERLGEFKFPNGRKYDVNHEDFVNDFGKDLKKKFYVLLQHKIRDLLIFLKENKFPTSYIQNKELRKQLGSIQSSSSETEDTAVPSTSS